MVTTLEYMHSFFQEHLLEGASADLDKFMFAWFWKITQIIWESQFIFNLSLKY